MAEQLSQHTDQTILNALFGVELSHNSTQAWHKMTTTLTGVSPEALCAERIALGVQIEQKQEPTSQERRHWNERRWAFEDVQAILRRDDAAYASTLTHWLTYRNMMAAYGVKSDGSATALMLGATTPISSLSFRELARREYGADRAVSVDLVTGKDKAQLGGLVLGNALELPFQDQSFDFVHTNCLIHQLQNPQREIGAERNPVDTLLAETERVLRPGGQMLFLETPPLWSCFLDTFEPERGDLGFTPWLAERVKKHAEEVQIGACTYAVDTGFLYVPYKDIDHYPATSSDEMTAIYARKAQ